MVIEVEALLLVGRKGCGFPPGLSAAAPVVRGDGLGMGMGLDGDGREGETSLVLSLPHPPGWITEGWSTGSFLHGQSARVVGHTEVTCHGPGHTAHLPHGDTAAQDDEMKADSPSLNQEGRTSHP